MLPESPFNLLQEIYQKDPWKILVCCMFLNQTTRKQTDGVREDFFEKYPSAYAAAKAVPEEMSQIIKTLGFYTRRANSIIRMSRDYIDIKWTKPSELHGIGQYAEDSYNIFVNHDLTVKPSDKILMKYMEWRLEYERTKS
jgi:methyl-CpG-binding domain protein 4